MDIYFYIGILFVGQITTSIIVLKQNRIMSDMLKLQSEQNRVTKEAIDLNIDVVKTLKAHIKR